MYAHKGRSSKGCQKCRSRKIGCDGERPVCGRCVKSGSESACVYPDQNDLIFRDQNSQAAQKATDKWRSRAKKSPQENDVSASLSSAPDIIMRQHDDLEDRALQRFMYDWVLSEPVANGVPSGNSFLLFLPGMYATAKLNSLLSKAVSAVAYGNYAQRYSSTEARRRAIAFYADALNAMQTQLNDLSENGEVNGALLSIFLLGIYELLSDGHMHEHGSWSTHLQGLSALFHVKYQDMEEKVPGSRVGLTAVVFIHMLGVCVGMGHKPMLPLETRELFSTYNRPLFYEQWELFYGVAELSYEWKSAFNASLCGEDPSNTALKTSLHKGLDLIQRHRQWIYDLSQESQPQLDEIVLSEQPEWTNKLLASDCAPKRYYTYPTLQIQQRFRVCHSSVLVLLQAVIHTLQYLENTTGTEHTQQSRGELETELVQLVDAVCEANVGALINSMHTKPDPTTSEDIPTLKGNMIFWPTGILSLCVEQTPLQTTTFGGRREFVRDMLRFLYEDLGFMKASAYLDMEVPDDPRPQHWWLHR